MRVMSGTKTPSRSVARRGRNRETVNAFQDASREKRIPDELGELLIVGGQRCDSSNPSWEAESEPPP